MTWKEIIAKESEKDYFKQLNKNVKTERLTYNVYPENKDVFNAFKLTTFDSVKVVILGQDPYHGAGQAHGLSFSVQKGVRLPPSLLNIYTELLEDKTLNFKTPDHGNLTEWAEQGVLLLNSTLTVRQATPNSHEGFGWPTFTDNIIRAINKERKDVVFMLWGAYAKSKSKLIDHRRHSVLTSAHPSPFSANRGFFGCRHFAKANETLNELGITPINWQLT